VNGSGGKRGKRISGKGIGRAGFWGQANCGQGNEQDRGIEVLTVGFVCARLMVPSPAVFAGNRLLTIAVPSNHGPPFACPTVPGEEKRGSDGIHPATGAARRNVFEPFSTARRRPPRQASRQGQGGRLRSPEKDGQGNRDRRFSGGQANCGQANEQAGFRGQANLGQGNVRTRIRAGMPESMPVRPPPPHRNRLPPNSLAPNSLAPFLPRTPVLLPLSRFDNGEAAEYVEVGWIQTSRPNKQIGRVRSLEKDSQGNRDRRFQGKRIAGRGMSW
jgi:hypothetical protein